MEFPDLDEHCSERTCKQLDFLLLKCDACGGVFCKDHIAYSQHRCSSAYKKDVQVPVCPLCNAPIPVKKGEMANIVVGSHMDKGCQPDSAWQKVKVFTNKCFRPGCKKKEMMKLQSVQSVSPELLSPASAPAGSRIPRAKPEHLKSRMRCSNEVAGTQAEILELSTSAQQV